MAADSNEEDSPSWTPSPITEAEAFKYVLIGISKEDAFGNITDCYQIHGVIESLAPNEMVVSLRGSRSGEKHSLPPTIDWLHPAAPGEYRLRQSGEVVVDPDYTASFILSAPQKH